MFLNFQHFVSMLGKGKDEFGANDFVYLWGNTSEKITYAGFKTTDMYTT